MSLAKTSDLFLDSLPTVEYVGALLINHSHEYSAQTVGAECAFSYRISIVVHTIRWEQICFPCLDFSAYKFVEHRPDMAFNHITKNELRPFSAFGSMWFLANIHRL